MECWVPNRRVLSQAKNRSSRMTRWFLQARQDGERPPLFLSWDTCFCRMSLAWTIGVRVRVRYQACPWSGLACCACPALRADSPLSGGVGGASAPGESDHCLIIRILLTLIHGYGILVLIRLDIESSPARKSLFTESGLPGVETDSELDTIGDRIHIDLNPTEQHLQTQYKHTTNTPLRPSSIMAEQALDQIRDSSMAKLYMIPPVDLPDQQLTEAPLSRRHGVNLPRRGAGLALLQQTPSQVAPSGVRIRSCKQRKSIDCVRCLVLFFIIHHIRTSTAFSLSAVLLELPVPIVQWANRSGLEPSRNAVKVERMLSLLAEWHEKKGCAAVLRCIFPRPRCILRL
ncbi:hypothetical protein Lal_00011154 [Lupinus albus]|nr:hypothetical protein Lal_00011154 [Lupinus albus]